MDSAFNQIDKDIGMDDPTTQRIREFEEQFRRIAISKAQASPSAEPPSQSRESDSTQWPETSDFYRGRVPKVVLHKDLQNLILLAEAHSNPEFSTGVPLEQVASRGVPRSNKEMTLNFSRQEKLLLYDYCIKKTGHFSVAEVPYTYMEGESTPSDAGTSRMDTQVQRERGRVAGNPRKRHRKRFRRRVPTYTDELRKIIQRRMKFLEDYLEGADRRRTLSNFKIDKRLQLE